MTSTAALFEGVLVLPRPYAVQAAGRYDSFTEIEFDVLLRNAIDEIRRTAAGSEVQATVASLLPESVEDDIGPLSRWVVTELRHGPPADHDRNGNLALDQDGLAASLYDQAVNLVAAGQIDQAIILLAAIVTTPAGEADGLLGLAVCAARLHRYPAALVLAVESLRRNVKHPLACCIAGMCELERGDRRAAQNYLAMAARLARQKPAWRDELRAAQRLLLMMHIAQ